MSELTLDLLDEAFRFVDGKLIRRYDVPWCAAGEEAGCITLDGYRSVNINGNRYKTHRIIYAMTYGEFPPDDKVIHHRNGDSLDNTPENLQVLSIAEHKHQHRQDPQKNNTSGHPGIVWDKARSKWAARYKLKGKHVNLGRFKKIEDAIAAREKALTKLEFSND